MVTLTSIIMFTMQVIYSFETPGQLESWRIINDGVMGGLSQSRIEHSKEGFMIFSGDVSLENNGGFASCRTLPKLYNLSDYDGITIRVKGDGKTYSFRLWTDSRFDGVSYVQDFSTQKGVWSEIRLPFSDFHPQFRGRRLTNYPALKTSMITQFGVLISDKQEGAFILQVDRIAAYPTTKP